MVGGPNCHGGVRRCGTERLDIRNAEMARRVARDLDDAIAATPPGALGGGPLQNVEDLERFMVGLVEDHTGSTKNVREGPAGNGFEIGAHRLIVDGDDELERMALPIKPAEDPRRAPPASVPPATTGGDK